MRVHGLRQAVAAAVEETARTLTRLGMLVNSAGDKDTGTVDSPASDFADLDRQLASTVGGVAAAVHTTAKCLAFHRLARSAGDGRRTPSRTSPGEEERMKHRVIAVITLIVLAATAMPAQHHAAPDNTSGGTDDQPSLINTALSSSRGSML